MTERIKIYSILFLAITAGLIIYLSFALKQKNNFKIEILSLEGDNHLSKEQYLQFSNLLDRSNYKDLTIQVIKDRIEKHPYIARAEVRYDGNNEVSIRIIEKNFDSILLINDKQYLLTDELQVLPMIARTKDVDHPIISNPILDSVKVLTSLKKNSDVLIASKIISGIKLLNPELYDGLSTIDMRNGGDVVLFFSLFDYPVIIGRGNEIRKIVSFNNLWTYLRGKEINNYMDYVDLRYSKHVYFGILQTRAKQS